MYASSGGGGGGGGGCRPNVTSPDSALASEVFDRFCSAVTFKSILSLHRQLCDLLRLKPTHFPQFYPKLKVCIEIFSSCIRYSWISSNLTSIIIVLVCFLFCLGETSFVESPGPVEQVRQAGGSPVLQSRQTLRQHSGESSTQTHNQTHPCVSQLRPTRWTIADKRTNCLSPSRPDSLIRIYFIKPLLLMLLLLLLLYSVRVGIVICCRLASTRFPCRPDPRQDRTEQNLFDKSQKRKPSSSFCPRPTETCRKNNNNNSNNGKSDSDYNELNRFSPFSKQTLSLSLFFSVFCAPPHEKHTQSDEH